MKCVKNEIKPSSHRSPGILPATVVSPSGESNDLVSPKLPVSHFPQPSPFCYFFSSYLPFPLVSPADTAATCCPPFSVFCLYSFSLVTQCPPPHIFLCCMSLEEVGVERAGCRVNRKNHTFVLPFITLSSHPGEGRTLKCLPSVVNVDKSVCKVVSSRRQKPFISCGRRETTDAVHKTQHQILGAWALCLQVQDWRVLIPSSLKSCSKIRTWALTQQHLTAKKEPFQCFPWPAMVSLPIMGGGLLWEREPRVLGGTSVFSPRFHHSWALWDRTSFLTSPCLSFLICKLGRWELPASTTHGLWATGWNQHLWRFCEPVEVTRSHFGQVGELESWGPAY